MEGCQSTTFARDLCRLHYKRWQATGNVGPAERMIRKRQPHGTRWVAANGYAYLVIPGGKAAEHRVVMEGMLGRSLRPFETVHHINGVRHDNRPENLELWVKPQPAGQRPEDLAEWVVQQYPELVAAALDGRSQLQLVAN